MDKDALLAVFSEASHDGWSLRSDVQLQEWLESFAERLKERTRKVAGEVYLLGTETGNVELHLKNSLNRLRDLSATQFIENRVDEVDEGFVKMEQPSKQSRVEGYDSQIVPRYKEAVLAAWGAFEGFRSNKIGLQSSNAKLGSISQGVRNRPSMKLPHVIGTEEFARDSHCGLADFKIPEVNTRVSTLEAVESGSDTDRDEAKMAEEMVGGRPWLDGEWSASESETSGHQGGVLEPAVSAALDFKAMLEAALRGPSFPYDGGITLNLENADSYVDNTSSLLQHILSPTQEANSENPRTRSEPEEVRFDGDLPPKKNETSVECNEQHQDQLLASQAPTEVNRRILIRPPLLKVQHQLDKTDNADVAGSVSPQNLSPSKPSHTPVAHGPFGGYPKDQEPTQGKNSRTEKAGTLKIQNNTTSSLPLNLRAEENKPQPASPASQSGPSAFADDLPTPTLPDNLFQGLRAAIQARQLRSQSNPISEDPAIKEPLRPEVAEGRKILSPKTSIASRLSPINLNLKDNRGIISKNKGETTSRLQTSKVAPGRIPQRSISFQGGLFDDDDDDEIHENTSPFPPKGVPGTPKTEVAKLSTNPSSPLWGSKLVSTNSMARQRLFDDFNDLSAEPPIESESTTDLGLTDQANSSQQPFLTPPDWKSSNRSSALKKSLFGDSDNEESE